MRRIAFTCLCLALPGCGYNTWWEPPFTTGSNPNFPAGDSENMRRVTGEQVESPALTPEPGDIWPGPVPPEPTLQELEQGGLQSAAEQPVPGSPQFQGTQPPNLPPPPASRGSSTPPGSSQPGLTPLPAPTPPRSPDTTTAGAAIRRPGLHHPAGPRGLRRRYQRLPDHHPARRRLRPSSCPMAMAPVRSYIRTARVEKRSPHHVETAMADAEAPTDHPLLRLAARAHRHVSGERDAACRRAHGRRTHRLAVRACGPGHASAFANRRTVRCAVNQDFADPTTRSGRGDEVAFFPPVTGG